MKKRLVVLPTFMILFFSLATVIRAQDFIKKFSLKFNGGLSTVVIGDYNTFIDAQDSYFDTYAVGLGITKEGELKRINVGIEFEGEIIMDLTENFGIGVGAGYLQISKDNETSLKQELLGKVTYFDGPKFTAIPANLSLYYFYPVASSMNLFLNGGVGYYFGKATSSSRLDYELIGELSEWAKSEGEFKDQGLGFHGGIGLEFMIGSNIGLFIEGKGRYCKLKSWEGNSTNTDSDGFTEKNSGTLWLVEELDPDTDVWFYQIKLEEQEPSGPNIRNVRKFEGDLSGFSIRAGIRIKF